MTVGDFILPTGGWFWMHQAFDVADGLANLAANEPRWKSWLPKTKWIGRSVRVTSAVRAEPKT